MYLIQRLSLPIFAFYGLSATAYTSDDGRDQNIVNVRFAEDTDVSSPTLLALPTELSDSVESVSRLITLDTKTLKELQSLAPDLPDMSLWHKIKLKVQKDHQGENLLDHLLQLGHVEVAEFALVPQELPSRPTPEYSSLQTYFDKAPSGIDAKYSHSIPGGDGTGIKVTDIEYEWNTSHEDLDKAHKVELLVAPGDTPAKSAWGNDHGTAVIGELIGTTDAIGITGICPGATIGMAPTVTQNLGFNVANAIMLATEASSAGDVILLEQQAPACGFGGQKYGPPEVDRSVFDAIQTATAKGVTVVATAGNGSVNLDHRKCRARFGKDIDSGAIIVGAGGPAGSSSRVAEYFSTYGSRVDVQGWGQGVATAGYGDLWVDKENPDDNRKWYTNSFSGTSSAAPIVAGAVANIQGVAKKELGKPLDPETVRKLLKKTGTPQKGSRKIGPLPNLKKAIKKVRQMKDEPPSCKNKRSSCDSWAKKGYCTRKYVRFMKKNCPKSCDSCDEDMLTTF